MKVWRKRFLAIALSTSLVTQICLEMPFTQYKSIVLAEEETETEVPPLSLTHNESISIGTSASAGGNSNSIAYNSDNQKVYQINSNDNELNIFPIASDGTFDTENQTIITFDSLFTDFTCAGPTYVAIDTINDRIAVTLESGDTSAVNGRVCLLDYDGNLQYYYETGVQPNMAVFTADSKKLLITNEGEHKSTYTVTDPKGTVTIIDFSRNSDPTRITPTEVDFSAFTADELIENSILLNKIKNTNVTEENPDTYIPVEPQYDLEPESIAVNDAGTTAYVCLQEANAIATLDLTTNEFVDIRSLGFIDYSDETNAIDVVLDKTYSPTTYQYTYGVPMPHSIELIEIEGTTYLLTANEGASRTYCYNTSTKFISNLTTATLTSNEPKVDANGDPVYDANGEEVYPTAASVQVLNNTYTAGLEEGVEEDGSDTPHYIFGTRSFSIYEADSMSLLYDSANSLEAKTNELLPSNFNCTNNMMGKEKGATARGVEPKAVITSAINGRYFAFIALEAIGGVMVYEITDPSTPEYINYINTRDFSTSIKGDVSPGCIALADANSSKNELPTFFVGYDVTATLGSYTITATDEMQDFKILYTNDIHGQITGYPYLATYRQTLNKMGYRNVLIDGGDSLSGNLIASQTQGSAMVDIMNQLKYDIAVPGETDFSYGVEKLLQLAAQEADFSYLSSNLIDVTTNKEVFDGYTIKKVNNIKIGFVGITTPECYNQINAPYFETEDGTPLYSFSDGENFYNTIQTNVDSAIAEGAQYIVAIGHTGVENVTSDWSATSIIENTSGINLYLDAHSHEKLDDNCLNKNEEEVTLFSTGAGFENFGVITIESDGNITTEMLATADIDYEETPALTNAYRLLEKYISDSTETIHKALSQEAIGCSETDLSAYSMEDNSHLMAAYETNLGNLVADAYRTLCDADIALADIAGIDTNISAGNITQLDIANVVPNDRKLCVIEATGQQIANALEFAVKDYPDESVDFLQVSGLHFAIHSDILSPVILDEYEAFESIDNDLERRVKNIKIGTETIVPNKKYTIAGNINLFLDNASYSKIFKNCSILKYNTLPRESEILIQYITDTLDGVVTEEKYGELFGDGRIIDYYEDISDNDDDNNEEDKGNTDNDSNHTGGNSNTDNSDSNGNNSSGSLSNTDASANNANKNTNENATKNNTKKIKVKKAKITSLKVSRKKIKVKIKKVSGAKGYQIKYSTKKSFKKKYTKTITVRKPKATLKKLKKGKKYYVKVRAYKLDTNKKKVYGKYSIVKRSKKVK